MAHLVWQDDLSTGIQAIDNQHKCIVRMINHPHDAQQGKGHAAIAEVIEELADYTLSHSALEETPTEDSGYQFSRVYKKTHELLIRRVSEYRVCLQASEDVGDEPKGPFPRWLLNHICNDDAGYVDAIRHNMSELVKDRSEGGWLLCSMKRFSGRSPEKET